MAVTDRLAAERTFHDRQAAARAPDLSGVGALRFSDDWYLDHETWIRPAFDRLGDVSGRRVLDLGCGHGMAAVVLARRGARVTALDLSRGYLDEACRRAGANAVHVDFVQGDAERLPFADGSFDAVWANAVLHHLDPSIAAGELRRVLRPGGVAVCSDPWGGNAILNWARWWLPYPGKERTRDEQPLRGDALRPFYRVFAEVRVEGFQLLAIVRRVFGTGRMVGALQKSDAALLRRLPFLWRYCRYVVLTLRG
jgi:SAM-dependent methyltransferase